MDNNQFNDNNLNQNNQEGSAYSGSRTNNYYYSNEYNNPNSQQNGNASQNAYHYGSNPGANTYNQQNNGPYNAYGNAYTNPYAAQEPKKPKRVRQSRGWGRTFGKTVAVALVFGVVAGSTLTGVNYVGSNLLGGKAKTENGSNASSQNVLNKSVSQTAIGVNTELTDVSSVVSEVMPSIVAITNTGTVTYQTFWGVQEQESQSAGSGIIISEDDKYLYVVTNNHVVADADSLTVQFADNKTVSCEVKGTDAADDLAVVSIEKSSIDDDTLKAIKVATIGDSDKLEMGNPVIAIGNALGYGQSTTVGYVSALGRTVTVQDQTSGETTVYNNMIQTDAAINPGNSGGALINANGEVVGINSVKYSDTTVEGFGYAIPMSDASSIINQLITREKVDKSESAYLGIQGQDISSDVASAYNMPEGIYVYQVLENSAAAEAGLRQGDIITAFDGQSVSTMSQLKELMTYYKAGQEVSVKINRLGQNQGYEEQEIKVTLGSASNASVPGRTQKNK